MTWEHKPDRVPQLDRRDLETIALLVREYGNKHVPLFSKRLMLKVHEAMESYRLEDALLNQARENHGKNKNGPSAVPEKER